MTVELYENDIPSHLNLGSVVAVDAEMMGLHPRRDRLCLVQLSAGDGNAHLVKFSKGPSQAPNLKKLLTDTQVTKIFHFARLDMAMMKTYLGLDCGPVYCTKTASRLARTYTEHHGLKEVCKELLGIEIPKQQGSSDWGAEKLTPEQINYAATDVLYLHAIRDKLDVMLQREGRMALAEACFRFLPTRVALDLAGWPDLDIFAH